MVIRSETRRKSLITASLLLLGGILLAGSGAMFMAGTEIGSAQALSLTGLMLASLGVVASLLGWSRTSFLLGIVVAAIGTYGLLSLLLAYGGFGGGVGRFGHALVSTVALPLNIAGPLTFSGIVLAGLAGHRNRQAFLDLALATAVVAMAAILFIAIGEAAIPELAFESLDHHQPSRLEITLLVMFALALAMAAAAAKDADFLNRGMFVPYLAFLLVLASSFNFWMFLVEKEEAIVLEQTAEHAVRLQEVIKERQSDRLLALMRMAQRYEYTGGKMGRELWITDARAYLEAYDELVAAAMVSPEMIIRWGLTLDNEHFGVGRDYGSDPLRERLLVTARETRSPVFSPAMDLFPEQAGQVMVLPLFGQDRFLGWLIASIGFEVLLGELTYQVAEEFAVRVWLEGELVFSTIEMPGESLSAASTETFEANGYRWMIEISPTADSVEKRLPWLPSLMLLAGIIAACLFGFALLKLGQLRNTTAELAYNERRYRIVAEQTGELVYDADIESGAVFWAGAIDELAELDAGEIRAMDINAWRQRIHPDDRRDSATPVPATDESRRYRRNYRLKVNQHYLHVEDEGVVLVDDAGMPIRMLGAIKDVTQRHEQEEQLRYMAHHDQLTGLLNRARFMQVLETELIRAAGSKPGNGQPAALVLIDLDRFRAINETLGYATGDNLLCAVTERLARFLDMDIPLARISSDGFALLMQDGNAERVREFCQRLIDAFSLPFNLNNHSLFTTLTIGIALFPGDSESAEDLFQSAETALAKAKERGRNQLLFFDPSMRGDAAGNLWIANKLRDALENREFQLYFQPRVNFATGRVTGMEALLRWFRPDGESISPGRFIPVAEESGMIGPIGWYVVDAAIDAAEQLGAELMQDRRIAINVSARQLMDRDFAAELISRLVERGASPDWFEIELTESMLMDDPELARELTADLHRAGFRIAIDDFGTGYSSLNYLKHLSVDYLKIDQSFVRGLPRNEDDIAIVSTIIGMAHSLRLALIAEGIEEESQRTFLMESGCEEGQGFLMARPMPLDELEVLLKKG